VGITGKDALGCMRIAVARGRWSAALRFALSLGAGWDATARLFSRCWLLSDPIRSGPICERAVAFGRPARGPGRRIEIRREIGRRASRSSGGELAGNVDGRVGAFERGRYVDYSYRERAD